MKIENYRLEEEGYQSKTSKTDLRMQWLQIFSNIQYFLFYYNECMLQNFNFLHFISQVWRISFWQWTMKLYISTKRWENIRLSFIFTKLLWETNPYHPRYDPIAVLPVIDLKVSQMVTSFFQMKVIGSYEDRLWKVRSFKGFFTICL